MKAQRIGVVSAVLAVAIGLQGGPSASERARDAHDSVARTTTMPAPPPPSMLQTINDDLEVVGSVMIRGPHPWADVTAFGAVPDDSGDDTAEIQAAIDSVSGGGVVYIPKGWYKTTGLTVPKTYNNVRIVGAGRGAIIELTGAGSIIRFSGSDGGVENLTLDCRGVGSSTGLRVAPNADTDLNTITQFNNFHNLYILGCRDAGITMVTRETSAAWYNTFHTIHVRNSNMGIHMKNSGSSEAWGPNRNNFFAVRIGQASGLNGETSGGGLKIEYGDTNAFFGLALEGLALRGIDIGAAGTDGTRFYSTTIENVGSSGTYPEIDNDNRDTQFLGTVGVAPWSAVNGIDNFGIGTGTERPKTKLHVEVGGGSTLDSGTHYPEWGGVTLSGHFVGEPGYHSYAGLRPNGFQQSGNGPYAGGVTLQRFHFDGTSYKFQDVLNVTASANVGIGEVNPGYKLHVNGSAGATSWNVISSRLFKQDIEKLDDTRYQEMLRRLQGLDLATYRYKPEYRDGDDRRRVGLIAEDLPEELLSKDRKSVDLYELSSFALGAMKAQQQQIDAQAKALAAMQEKLDRLIADTAATQRKR
jgi:hypothetical protein